MIRVVMLGRTGNNLFQYAFGRMLAQRHDVPLVMDGSWFNREGWESVSCLRRLGLKVQLVRRASLASRVLKRVAGKHPWEFGGRPIIRENPVNHGFDETYLEAPPECAVFGYFQSVRYFAAIEESIRAEVDLDRLEWSKATLKTAAKLRGPGTVAVHVRRTDFVGNPVFDVCGPGYYQEVMDQMRQQHEGLRFHLFSDDPIWCREHLASSDAEVCCLPEGLGDPLHDLFLMSCANHHIIANSSYSWWAAWLGKKSGQTVMVPPRWFAGQIEAPIEDKLCDGWSIGPGDKPTNNE